MKTKKELNDTILSPRATVCRSRWQLISIILTSRAPGICPRWAHIWPPGRNYESLMIKNKVNMKERWPNRKLVHVPRKKKRKKIRNIFILGWEILDFWDSNISDILGKKNQLIFGCKKKMNRKCFPWMNVSPPGR